VPGVPGCAPAPTALGSRKVALADPIIAEARRRAVPEPNIDFALGTLTSTAGMDFVLGFAFWLV
jgi:hypothetical protein